MTQNATEPNMHRVEEVVLKPDTDELSTVAASEALIAAGFDEQQMDSDKFDTQLQQWKNSDRWTVQRSSSIHHEEVLTWLVEDVTERGSDAVARLKTQSWHNEMMEIIECPECGLERTRLSLHGHRNSRRCRAKQNKNEVDELGLRRVHAQSTQLRELIRKHSEVGLEQYRTKYVSGSRNRRSVLRSLNYATEEGIQKAREEYLPAPVTRASGYGVNRGRIMWRDENYCVVATDDAVLVIDVEDSERIYRRRTLYLSGHSGSRVVYNSDGWRVGTPITEYTGEITDQIWHSDRAVLVIEVADDDEQMIELPYPVDTATRKSDSPEEDNSGENLLEDEADDDIASKPTLAGFIPGEVVVTDNGVIVEV